MENLLTHVWLCIVALSISASAQSSDAQTPHLQNKNKSPINTLQRSRKDCLHLALIRHLLRDGPIKRFQPEYPEAAKKKGITGAVDVVVYINEEGKVYSAAVCKGHPLLRQAALDAAYKDEFKPLQYQDKIVKSVTMLTFFFHLEQ